MANEVVARGMAVQTEQGEWAAMVTEPVFALVPLGRLDWLTPGETVMVRFVPGVGGGELVLLSDEPEAG